MNFNIKKRNFDNGDFLIKERKILTTKNKMDKNTDKQNFPVLHYVTDGGYEPLIWQSPSPFIFPNFSTEKGNNTVMVRLGTIMDGNCFFHAIANAIYPSYQTGYRDTGNGQKMAISKEWIVRSMREQLAYRLSEPIHSRSIDFLTNLSQRTTSIAGEKTVYDTLWRGTLREFSKGVPEYTLTNMQRTLRGSKAVDNVYNEFISNEIDKDIYLLNGETHDVYFTGDDDDILYKNRPSIVILVLPGHYELVGLLFRNNNSAYDEIETLFDPQSSFIQAIRSRMQQIRLLVRS